MVQVTHFKMNISFVIFLISQESDINNQKAHFSYLMECIF